MATLIENKKILDEVAFDASQTSSSDYIGDCKTYAIQFIWSGATGATGDLIVEGSIDNATFVPVDSFGITGESSGSRLVNVEIAGYSHVRVRWAYSAGSNGTLSVYIASKKEER